MILKLQLRIDISYIGVVHRSLFGVDVNRCIGINIVGELPDPDLLLVRKCGTDALNGICISLCHCPVIILEQSIDILICI